MIYFTSTLLNIIVYLITFAVMWRVFRKREKELMWNLAWSYRENYFRMCHTFIDTMQAVTKAMQAQQAEDETEEDEAPAPDPEYIEPYPEMLM